MRPISAPLARLATRQHGVVWRRQLERLGLSDQMIRTLIARGQLLPIHPGVYAVGHARLSIHGRWLAAVLACGTGAALSHGDAAALHDLRRTSSGLIHVTASGRHRLSGVRCHTARDLGALCLTVVDGIPATSLERTALDQAVVLSPQRLRSLLEEIERRDRFDLGRFEAALALGNGHRGVGRLRAAIAAMSAQPPELRSGLERRVLELLRETGVPEPSVNVGVAGETVDLRWPQYRVTVEIDSWRYHRTRRAFDDDRRRGNAVSLSGEMLLRFTDRQITSDPHGAIAQVVAALRAAGWGVMDLAVAEQREIAAPLAASGRTSPLRRRRGSGDAAA